MLCLVHFLAQCICTLVAGWKSPLAVQILHTGGVKVDAGCLAQCSAEWNAATSQVPPSIVQSFAVTSLEDSTLQCTLLVAEKVDFCNVQISAVWDFGCPPPSMEREV